MLNPELKKQVRDILAVILVLGALQLAVFFVLSFFVRLSFVRAAAGTAAGCLTAALNFVLLAVSVEKSVAKNERRAQSSMGISYILRLILIAAAVFAVIKLPNVFNLWAAIIPLIFPRIAIMLINLKNKGGENT